ncbi:hypothetical protein [Speluncibacter jeojiensis]|uniref:Uncharacterized protein n=1 Tax=Speluncibacter jeojiensis TaxID=2710754 RepID=A0A9X4M6V1_9ACTN|nr:hypothetical protein [Corynebacteriales bacterium D3-21]
MGSLEGVIAAMIPTLGSAVAGDGLFATFLGSVQGITGVKPAA